MSKCMFYIISRGIQPEATVSDTDGTSGHGLLLSS